jgi:hypothetical protein
VAAGAAAKNLKLASVDGDALGLGARAVNDCGKSAFATELGDVLAAN